MDSFELFCFLSTDVGICSGLIIMTKPVQWSSHYFLHWECAVTCCPLNTLSYSCIIQSHLCFLEFFLCCWPMVHYLLRYYWQIWGKWKALTHLELLKRGFCFLTPLCCGKQLEASFAFTTVRKCCGLKVCIWQQFTIFLEFHHRAGYTSRVTPWAIDGCRAMVAIHLCQGLSFASLWI